MTARGSVPIVALLALLACAGLASSAESRVEVTAPSDPKPMSIDKNALEWYEVKVNPATSKADCKYTCEQQSLISPFNPTAKPITNTVGVALCAVDYMGKLFPGSTMREVCKAVVFYADERPPRWDKYEVKWPDVYKCGCFSIFRPSTPFVAPTRTFFGECTAPSVLPSDVCRFKIVTNGGRTQEWRYGWTDGAQYSLPFPSPGVQFKRACNVVGVKEQLPTTGAGSVVVKEDAAVFATTGFEVLC